MFVSIRPASAITWEEFWEPFNGRIYYNDRYRVRYCTDRIRRTEYVPGNRWRSGYVRTWYDTVTVPCRYLR
jgi:hypothetical protein